MSVVCWFASFEFAVTWNIIVRRCVYVLPGDVLNVNERTVPYELDVEIIRDCSNFSSEIADVFDVIKTSCDDYSLVLKKVSNAKHQCSSIGRN